MLAPLPRRLLRGAALVTALAVAYGAGVVTGVIGADTPAPSTTAGVIEEAADRIADRAARPVGRDELERAAVEGMLALLGDRWSTYYEPADFASFADAVEGRYSGVGVWLAEESGGVVVGSVQPGTPAARAGIVPGDVVRAVSGKPVSTVAEAAALLRGEPQPDRAAVPVEVLLAGQGRERSVRLARTTISVSDVQAERLRGGVLRLAVSGFSRGTGRQVRARLTAGSGLPPAGVILDLRGNGGGLLTEAVEVASAFLHSGPVVIYEQRGAGRRTLDAVGEGDIRTPVVVLVDERTASAAEVVAAALQDRNRAVVVGAPTFGKGSVQEPSRLADGSALELTVGRYLTPAGRSLDGAGVQPDVLIRVGERPEVAESRAVDVLAGLLAARPIPSSSGRG